MKYLLAFVVCMFMVGCASISEYNQGCRDGVGAVRVNGQSIVPNEKSKNKFCDALDEEHRAEKKLERQGKRN